MTTTQHFGIFKDNEEKPFFVGEREVTERCLETLRKCFFFVAGNAKQITEEFPFQMKPV